jgi:uncharacterized membrane protein YfcA
MEMLAIFLSGLGAGFFGALVGLGGGVVMVPILNLIFGLPIKSAVATSLCAVCATSIGGTARYLKKDLVDFRMGLFLETTTIVGAIAGGLIAIIIKPEIVSVAFAAVLLYTSVNMTVKINRQESSKSKGLDQAISAIRKYTALALSVTAGMVSAMLGVGGGVVQVPILNLVLRYPIKSAVATSTFMIGITAATGTMVYFLAQIRGAVDFLLINYHAVAPLIIGTLAGSSIGALTAGKINARAIKIIFIIALLYAGLRIGLRGLGLELF